MRDPAFGPNQEARLEAVFGLIKELYIDGKVSNRLGHLKLSMFMSDANNFSVLHSKGNEARHMLPISCQILQCTTM